MISFLRASKQKILVVLLLVSVILFFNSWVPLPAPLHESLPAPQRALATYQFTPTGGAAVITGTALPILGMTAAAPEGTNLGDWRATLADDNLHWGFNSTATGYNIHLDIGGVQLNNANKLFIQTEFDLDATVPATLVQICDWVSAVGVHNVADAQCTGGGWRNLNVNDVAITIATPVAYSWAIYNGYWDATATTGISTPLTNFVDGTNRIRIRYFSTTNTTSSVHIDYLRVFAVINPVYSASGAVNLGVGAITGNYSQTIGTGVGTGQTGLDDVRFQVAGTATTPPDFYMSFTGVRTYPGANTILVRADYSCSATGINYRPRIFNFTSGLWEDLTTVDIPCLATDATNAWARNNIPIADYVSGGEVRIGWRGLANGTQGIRIDMIYIMIGSTNTSGTAEISFGSGISGNVINTRNLDMTGTTVTWDVATVVESNDLVLPIYAFDSDHDVTAEQATSMNIDFPVTIPAGSAATGIFFAGRFMAGVAGTVQMGLRDYGGSTSLTGGWTAIGPLAATGFIYGDNMTMATVASGGIAGMNINPKDHMDTVDNKMNIRLRTTLPTTAATRQWDFAMVSLQWTEDVNHPSRSYQFTPTGGAVITGTALPILGITAAAAEGVNLGDWRATLADDNLHFGVSSTATGYNLHLDIGGVQLNNANKLFIQTEFDLDATAPATFVQICDWVSSVGVHNVADAQCTTGGWRNLNVNDVAITIATPVTYSWAIYDGYWNSTAIARISTPLTNFVDGTNRVRIRYFSTTNITTSVHIDFLRIFAVVNPVYSPAGVTQISGGAPLGDYSMAIGTGVGGGAGAIQSGLDSVRFRVPGLAGAPSNFFFSFNNVRTYPGANTILVRAQYSCSATGISHRPSIWNFALSQWEDLTTASIACATANAIHAWARNNISIADYVSAGEVRIGWRGLANGTQEIQIDMIYMMIGSTNTSGTAEITFGTNAVGSVLATRDLDTLTATPNTWDVATVVESNTLGFPIYALDSDHDITAEQATSMNIDFPVTAPTNTFVTGAFFAGRFMAGAAGTVQMGLRDYGGSTILAGGGGGWTVIGPAAITAFAYTDNITMLMAGVAGMNLNPKDHMDTVDNKMNIRLRTTLPTTAATRRWDFAMVSIQWSEVPVAPPPGETLTFAISDTTIGFGPLTSGAARFATGDTTGSATEVEAHNLTASTNAGSGYIISVSGTTLTFGAHTITPIGATNSPSAPGTEQFGIRAVATGGTGVVSIPYAAGGFALDTAAFPDEFASAPGATALTTFSVRYLANIAAMTEPGRYSANVIYTITGRF